MLRGGDIGPFSVCYRRERMAVSTLKPVRWTGEESTMIVEGAPAQHGTMTRRCSAPTCRHRTICVLSESARLR